MAWASILSLPYALLSTVIPYQKMGLFMGIFNFFIVLPQILAASILGIIVGQFFGGEPVYALVVGGRQYDYRRSSDTASRAARIIIRAN